ncbi:MAG: 16S rRNA (cytosine(1402)-N(4))-methyltransferase RsmH [Thermomicrobiales bacterium]
MPQMPTHIPVMRDEVLAAFHPSPGGRYIDGTFGGGGHARAILEASAPDGRVLALDRDAEAVVRGAALAAEPLYRNRLQVVQASFVDLLAVGRQFDFLPVDGILLDLGLSSFQMDDPGRGFAFSHDGPLDMRFDQETGVSAFDLVNAEPVERLAEIIWMYGEDRRSRQIARAIVESRDRSPISSTAQLAAIIEKAVGGRRGAPMHPATRTFQALRIAVNDELQALSGVLPRALEALKPGGVIAVIAFHSLEDRIVKQFFRREVSTCICPPEQPVCTCEHIPSLADVRKPVKPSQDEIDHNPRSRSAVLRVATRRSRGIELA